jgi:hypothetical protein
MLDNLLIIIIGLIVGLTILAVAGWLAKKYGWDE